MKRLLSILFYLLIATSSIRAQIDLDGNLSDWDTTSFKYDNENKLHYQFKKDENFLYLAILKDYNGTKALSGGGVELFFDKEKPDSNSFSLTYAHRLVDPVTKKVDMASFDFFELNSPNGKKQLLPKYNETGISVACFSYVETPKEQVVHYDKNRNVASVFKSEVQIPLEILRQHYGNSITFKIRLRGMDKSLKGEGDIIRRRLFSPEALEAIETRKMYECMFFTEYIGKLDLNKI